MKKLKLCNKNVETCRSSRNLSVLSKESIHKLEDDQPPQRSFQEHKFKPQAKFIIEFHKSRMCDQDLLKIEVYTLRKNCLGDPRTDYPRLVKMRKAFLELLTKLWGLGSSLVYIDESVISPSTISTWSWKKRRTGTAVTWPLIKDQRYCRSCIQRKICIDA